MEGVVKMKRVVLIMIILAMLTGCRYQDFDYGSTVVDRPEKYVEILDMIMDEGNYPTDVKGPYSRVQVFVNYINGVETIEVINISRYRDYSSKNDETTYDTTDCFNVDGELKCSEHKSVFEGERILPEIEFKYAFDQFIDIDIPSMVSVIKSHYEIGYTKSVLIGYKFIQTDDIAGEIENAEDVAYFYDGEYQYDVEYTGTDMMLQITLYLFFEEGGARYIIFKELDE